MDGNGRWAEMRGLTRDAGHWAGVPALRDVVKAAPGLGISTLTVYALSSDNLKRPVIEVSRLFGILRHYLQGDISALIAQGIRLSVIGRRDRLPAGLSDLIRRAEAATSGGRVFNLRIAVDYSGRDAILATARKAGQSDLTRDCFSQQLCGELGGPDVDLLIRTSGEQRLSDFLLWEAAYAELYFTQVLWPDFDGQALAEAMSAFRSRSRRFGGLKRTGAHARTV